MNPKTKKLRQYRLPSEATHMIDPQGSMPSTPEIEQAVLGVLIAENSAASQEAMLHLTPESFFDPAHALIFRAIERLSKCGRQIDLMTVGQELKVCSELVAAGGMAYLTQLTQRIGSGAHVSEHVQILMQTQIARQVIQASYSALRKTLSDDQDIDTTLSELVDELERAQMVGIQQTNRQHISQVIEASIAQIKEREERYRSGLTTGITTGLKKLDEITNGWHAGELVIVAARPAMGKTALMLHLAKSAARSGVAVCLYSLEMSNVSIGNRLLASECAVEASHIRSGRLSWGEWAEIEAARASIEKLPIYTDDKAAVSMQYIATHSRIMNRRGQCSMVVIDYLQLMDSRSSDRGRNREQEVAQTSAAAKRLAKELGVPVVLLAQLSRAVETRGGAKEPMLSDLRESGAIEQDADVVLFIHRPEYYGGGKEENVEVYLSNGQKVKVPTKGFGTIAIAKNREGATGKVAFSYNSSLTQIADFDETPYLLSVPVYVGGSHGGSRGAGVGSRPVSSGSINYVAPTPSVEPAGDYLPF